MPCPQAIRLGLPVDHGGWLVLKYGSGGYATFAARCAASKSCGTDFRTRPQPSGSNSELNLNGSVT
jgi:hypothetical protein